MDIFRLFDLDGDGEIDQSEFVEGELHAVARNYHRPIVVHQSHQLHGAPFPSVVANLEDEAVLQFIGLHCHQHQLAVANTRYYVLKGMQKAKMLKMDRKHAALREKVSCTKFGSQPRSAAISTTTRTTVVTLANHQPRQHHYQHVRESLYMPYIQKFHSTLNDRNQVILRHVHVFMMP